MTQIVIYNKRQIFLMINYGGNSLHNTFAKIKSVMKRQLLKNQGVIENGTKYIILYT